MTDSLSIIKAVDEQLGLILDTNNTFTKITTRAADGALAKFHTFDKEKLDLIAAGMPEINRAVRALGRKNTQTTNRLMTLTMLNDSSPMRVVRQCLAEIENRRTAIKENRFKLAESAVKLEKLNWELEGLIKKETELTAAADAETDPEKKATIQRTLKETEFARMLKKVKAEKTAAGIADAMLYIEGALKDLASFQSSYQQICKNKGIPENWDERDLEEAEVKHHVRMSFLLCFRDVLCSGHVGMGTVEYLQQFGVHPMTAQEIVSGYIDSCKAKLNEQSEDLLDVDNLHDFLHTVEEKFKDQYLKVLREIGLEAIHEEWYMYQDPARKVTPDE